MIKKSFLLLITIVFLTISFSLTAQIEQPQRAEIELSDNENYFYVVSAEEKGLIAFREKDDIVKSGTTDWEFVKYDTALNQEWKREYKLDFDQEFIGYDYSYNDLFLLFRKGPYQQTEYKMIRVGLDHGDTTHFSIKNLIPIELSDFNVVGSAALLSGKVSHRAVVIHYNYIENKLKVLPGLYKNNTDITEIKVDDEKLRFNIVMTERTVDRRTTVATKTFNEDGELINNVVLSPEDNISILYGRSTSFEDGLQYVIGTYSLGNSNYSRGVYIAKIDDEGENKFNHYNFGDLENFFSYMKAKREDRIKKRIARRKIKGKKIKFNYKLLVHDIIEKDGQYIMLAEAYYPRYTNYGTVESASYYSSFLMRSRRFDQGMHFEGYKYTHAVVAGFDKEGRLLWDNSFEINDVVSFNLEKFVNASVEKDRIVLLYLYENVVRSKIISNNKVLEGKAFNDIKLKFEDDVVKNNENKAGGLQHWYGNTFFGFGVQTLKNTKGALVGGTRDVFYINKITYN